MARGLLRTPWICWYRCTQGGIVLIKIRENRRFFVCFVVLFCLCWLFPYTGDDWAWGSSIGIERLNKWFDNYNGRYVGNLIVLALTRSNLLKAITMSACLTGILYILQRMTTIKGSFVICALLLLAMPKDIIRQTIVWTSGFSNYTVSTFLTIIYIRSIYWIFDAKEQTESDKQKQHPLQGLLLVFLGLVNTLIVEHITIYNLVLSIFVIGYVLFKYRRVLVQQVGYLLGCIIGTICMFSNTAYSSIASGADEYRSVALSIGGVLRHIFPNYFGVIYEQFYMNNLVLNGAILAVCVWIYCILSKENTQKRVIPLMRICLGINAAYWVYSAVSVIHLSSTPKLSGLLYFEGIFTAISGFFLILFIVLTAVQYKCVHKMLFLIGSILFLTAELLVVTPIGPRCFFITYVLFILLLLELFKLIPKECIPFVPQKICMNIGRIGILSILVFYFLIFTAIYKTNIQNLAHIRQEVEKGAQTVEILNLPYQSYLHNSIPDEGSNLAMRYKLFYNLPNDIYLISVDANSDSVSE